MANIAGILPFGSPKRLEVSVTGLRRAGKTAFITSTIRNLCAYGYNNDALGRLSEKLPNLKTATWCGAVKGKIDPFPYQRNMDSLICGNWPPATAGVSKAEVSLRYKTTNMFRQETETDLILSLIDYPGEWLIDIAMEGNFDQWSARVLSEMRKPSRERFAREFLSITVDPTEPFSELTASRLHGAYVSYLKQCRDAGLTYLQPGRFLMPPENASAVAVPLFAPISVPRGVKFGSKTLVAEFRERYSGYLKEVNRFYADNFADSGSQIVLVDLIGALKAGRHAFNDTAMAIKAVYRAMRARQKDQWFAWFRAPKYRQVVFAVTKADHVPDQQRHRLQRLLENLLAEEDRSAQDEGAMVSVRYVSSIRCTTDDTHMTDIGEVSVVVGVPIGESTLRKSAIANLPDEPPSEQFWQAVERKAGSAIPLPTFTPPPITDATWNGVSHIGLDSVLYCILRDELA